MMWLVGAGYWGSKIKETLEKLGVASRVIDIKHGQTIDDITDTNPVILATPLWEHHKQVITLLDRGHDVYVEKPMATTLAEIEDIRSYVKPDQLLMVGHIFIHHPQMEQIKNLLASRAIGDITHVNSRRMNWGIYQTRTTPTLSLATHDISIVLELLGDDCRVSNSNFLNLTNNPGSYDRVYFTGRVGAATFDIDVSWAWPQRVRQTMIMGTNGQIIWDQDNNTITLVSNGIVNNRAVEGHARVYNYHDPLSPLEHELKHWITCVKERRQPSTGIDSAAAVARVIDQIDNADQKSF